MEKRKVVIDMKGIKKKFNIGKPNELEILHGIDLTIYDGEFVAIVGESGSGKSTLMNIIGAIDRPTEGEYFFNGKQLSKMSDKNLSKIRN
ncbi:MAG: ATP-binding cassette domain-containing protein, partial [Ruminococcus sp.]|nr:ATP-binding cassette domain-containing protein [Ruminococcus sp.]